MSVFLLNKISKLEAKPQNRVESAIDYVTHYDGGGRPETHVT
jgi:hypothetical protein